MVANVLHNTLMFGFNYEIRALISGPRAAAPPALPQGRAWWEHDYIVIGEFKYLIQLKIFVHFLVFFWPQRIDDYAVIFIP